MGYAPWSEGLGIVLARLHEELPGRPLLICEHGVGTDDDEWRCDVLRESLAIVEDAIDDGSTCAASSTGPASTTTSGTTASTSSSALFDRDREPKGSAALASAFARTA